MFEFARYLAEVFRATLSQFLLDAAAKATLLLIAAMVASALLRRSSAAVRHRMWCLTFAALFVLPALSGVLPKWRVAVLPYSSPLAPREESLSLAPQAEAGGAVNPVEIWEQPNVSARGGLPLAEREDYYTLARRADQPAARPLPMLAALWLSGLLLSLLPLVIGSLRTYLVRRHARPIADESWRELLNQLRQRLALSRRVQLYETDAVLMPMTWGVLRPVVMLPRQAREWPDRLRRIVLLHELAHIKRCDVGFQMLGRFVCAVYWFHPLAWYALRRLRIERELACDDCVVFTGERASDYAAGLLQIASSYRPVYFAAAVAMAQRKNLEHRLHALFDRARSHLPLGTRAANLLLVGVATLVTITAAVRLAPRATADDVAQPPTAQLPAAPEKTAVDNADEIAVVKAAETKLDVVTLRGRVLLPDGKPAAGAGLYWVRFKAPPPRKPEDIAFVKRAAADDEGRFEFSLMEHDAQLEKKVPRPLLAYLGYGVDWVEIVQDEVPEDTVLRLVQDNPIRGRVTNTEGRRVAGAKVTVRLIAASPSGNLDGFLAAWKPNRGDARRGLERQCYAARLLPQLTTVTDREGRFELSGVGAERLASVNISAPGLVSEDLEIINRDRFDAEQFNEAARAGMLPQMRTARRSSGLIGPIFEHVAETALVVRGIVFTGPDRKPVVRAIVGAQGNGLNNPISVQTDEMGHFELRGLPRSQNGGISVYAPRDSNLLFKSMKPALAPGQTVVNVEIEMREGVFVEGRVFDQATGHGVKSRVQFVPLPGNQYAEQPRPAVMQMAGNTTDDDGHFRMLIMPGIGVLTAQVQPGRQGDLNRPPPLSGIQPIPYRQASFSDEDSKRVTVAGDGDNRHFTDVHNMLRFLRGFNAVKVVDLSPGSEAATFDLPLDPGRATTIAIEDEQGQPVSDAIVSGVADAGQMVFRSAEPNCTIFGLGADRPRHVCILNPERRLATSFTMTGDELGPVTVRLGAVASIVGRALDPDGEPLADALVQINYERRSASDLFFFATRDQALKTDGDGRFRVENILPRERLALSFRQGDTFFGGPRITDEKHQLKPGEKLGLGEFTAKQLP